MRLFSTTGIVTMHFLAYSALLLAMKAIPDGPMVLVVSDPRAPAGAVMETIGAAGGSVVEATHFEWMTVAYSNAPDFPARLRKAGAFLVLRYPTAAGCLQRSN